MERIRTDKAELSIPDIQEFIKLYQSEYVPELDKLWRYYQGDNPKIKDKGSPDPNNPDNRTPVPYGRKIITTFAGYAYRPRYITYKSDDEAYLNELYKTFDDTNEHIKTSLHGRNTGIYGVSYELLYIDEGREAKADVKLAVIDPKELILIYDYSLEPKKLFAIRFYPVDMAREKYKIVVYSDKSINYYNGEQSGYGEMKIMPEGEQPNFFERVPVVPYYLNYDAQSLLSPVIPLIDDYDALVSDSINEFDRFAHAYLKLVKMSLSDQVKASSPGVFKSGLALLKQRRVFEQLPDKDAVSFLTKDIPTEYITFMEELIRKQIHVQSHVPDFNDMKGGELSGAAIDRLLFDFENVVSNAEAEFDTALLERIELITGIYKKTGRTAGNWYEVTVSHKRNKPVNLKEFADVSLVMKNAGFSQYSIVDIWPDDVFPDVEAELEREKEERDEAMPDIETIPPAEPTEEPEEDEDGDR